MTEAGTSAGSPGSGRRTVLLVEDDEAVRQLVRLTFEMHGFGVIEAGDGREGLRLLARHRPDAVVLDLLMPDMGGERMLAEVWASPEAGRTPVVVMTGRSEVPAEVVGLVGRRNVVAKPFDPDQLVERVAALLAD